MNVEYIQNKCLLMILLVLSGTVTATDYYAAPSGTGSTCTQAQPCGLDVLNGILKAGDVGLLAGGLYQNMQIKPINSGDPDRPITYQAHNGIVKLQRSNVLSQAAIRLENVSYIIVKGAIEVDGEGEYTNSKWKTGIEFLHSHHILIDGVKIKNIRSYGITIGDLGSDADTKWIDINNVLVERVGTYNKFPYDGTYNDAGYSIYIYHQVRNVRIRNSVIDRGGHDLITIKGQKVILRNNEWSNFWELWDDEARSSRLGDIAPGDKMGNRSLVIDKESAEVLVEGNHFHDLYQPTDQFNTSGHKPGGKNTIIRNNYWLRIHNAVGGTGSTDSGPDGVKWYHNSVYDAGGAAVDYDNTDDVKIEYVHFKNNIYHKIAQDSEPVTRKTNHVLVFTNAGDIQWGLGNIWAGNCFNSTNRTEKVWGAYANQDLATIQPSVNFYGNLLQTDPKYVSNDPQVPADMRLQATSPCIGAGVDLTNVVGSGTGTVITVKDARYFFDGHGWDGSWGDAETADHIQIGDQIRTIQSIDKAKHRITVTSPLTYSNGDGVNLPYSGQAPTAGVIYKQMSTPSPPTNLMVR